MNHVQRQPHGHSTTSSTVATPAPCLAPRPTYWPRHRGTTATSAASLAAVALSQASSKAGDGVGYRITNKETGTYGLRYPVLIKKYDNHDLTDEHIVKFILDVLE